MLKRHIPLCILISTLLPACASVAADSYNEASILKSTSTADATTTLIGKSGDETGQRSSLKAIMAL